MDRSQIYSSIALKQCKNSCFLSLLGRFLLILGVMYNTGCLLVDQPEIYSEPGFDWNTLKRDQILMTPLLDLRKAPQFEPGTERHQVSFSQAESLAFPEKFKQKFYFLRKDIRIFGAGGAFEQVSKIQSLPQAAEAILARSLIDQNTYREIKEKSQEIRFLMVMAIVDEKLFHSFSYTFRTDHKDDMVSYQSHRKLTVSYALWDSKINKTLWVATKALPIRASQEILVSNPTKYKVLEKKHAHDPGTWVWRGLDLSHTTLARLAQMKDRYPIFPDWRSSFEDSYASFSLALPMNPSEEKLIEYSWLTFHRPHAGLSWTPGKRLGDGGNNKLYPGTYAWSLGLSSSLARYYRVGIEIILGTADQSIVIGDTRYTGSLFGIQGYFGRTFLISEHLFAELGTHLGHHLVSLVENRNLEDLESETDPRRDNRVPEARTMEEELEVKKDDFISLSPSLFLWRGSEKQGFIVGGGVLYRYSLGADQEFTKRHLGLWQGLAFETRLGYTFRGF